MPAWVRQRKTGRRSRLNFGQQNGRLLNLPGELRNLIYEYVCMDIDKIILEGHPFPHVAGGSSPLSMTCRQVQYEFDYVLNLHIADDDNAARLAHQARQLLCPLRGLDYYTLFRDLVEVIKGFPPLPFGQKRILTQDIVIDNFEGDVYETGLRQNFLRESGKRSWLDSDKFDVRTVVTWNKGLDVGFFRYSKGMAIPRPGHEAKQGTVEHALVKAFERHEADMEAAAEKRARKRMLRIAARQAANTG